MSSVSDNEALQDCRKIIDEAINLLQGATWQSMNDKFIACRVIELLKTTSSEGRSNEACN